MKKIGFIGIGNMGGAILAGYAQSENSKNVELLAFDMNSELCSSTKEKIPQLELCSSGSELCKIADTVIIGVKPQVIGGVLEEIAGSYDSSKTVISMAAGISIEKVQRYLGDDAKIIRIMPNTPAKVGEAMVAMCRNDNVSDEIFDEATEIFAGIGRAEHIDESLIDCVIGVSGRQPCVHVHVYPGADRGGGSKRHGRAEGESVRGAVGARSSQDGAGKQRVSRTAEDKRMLA